MSGWERTRRRYHLVYGVAADVAREGRVAVEKWRPAIEDEYGDFDGFLLDVRRRWLTAVAAYSDYVPTPQAEADRSNSQLRAVLDAYAGQRAVHAEPA